MSDEPAERKSATRVAGDIVVGRLVAVRLGGDDDQRGGVGLGDAERGERRRAGAVRAGLLRRAAVGVGVEEAALRGGVDDAAGGDAVLDQRDVDGEVAAALHEFLGAVERVDEEEDRARRKAVARLLLLGDDRELPGRPRARPRVMMRVGELVGLGDRRGVGLGADREVVAAVDLEDGGASVERQPADGRDDTAA